ncbi:Aste57867_455 [Aphanomyces stellatus]|uniref:H/ACA ribonucleoprotein complex subunit n=1 Tax=Aphanomyces stellatus TaxID=120398 RepID=A0A485K2U4_9STRA|nr:hypothetical protein As57867_000454 [Aphanomyces stellatus]VFT77680.1 Aste57867_455 [Aphanomyces stellatus]
MSEYMDDVLVAAAYAGVDVVPAVAHADPVKAVANVPAPALEEGEEVEVTHETPVDQDMGESSDDEESEPDSDDEDQTKLRMEIEVALKKEEQGSLTSEPIVTAHEVSFKQLPVKKPTVELTADCPIAKMGRILSVNTTEQAITIQSVPNQLPLDEGSVLCLTNRVVLGCVDEVFGPVSLPLYLIRFETVAEMPQAAQMQADVFYATEHATYVEADKCRVKGSDASNFGTKCQEKQEEETQQPEHVVVTGETPSVACATAP